MAVAVMIVGTIAAVVMTAVVARWWVGAVTVVVAVAVAMAVVVVNGGGKGKGKGEGLWW